MKRLAYIMTLVTIVAAASSALAGTDKLITDIAAQTKDSLAFVTCTFEEETATQAAAGPAICIDKSGLFIAVGSFDTSMRNAKVKECRLTVPGLGSQPMAAEVVAIDRGTGMAFIKCTDPSAPKWTPIAFADKSNLTAGTELVSVTVMPGDISHPLYFGRACIASVRYDPQPVAYVTGGSLTGVCSPVFTGPGKAIGLVWRQSPQLVELTIGRQRSMAQINSIRDSTFFTPVEDFIEIIKSRGKRELAWTGILGLTAADKDLLTSKKFGVKVSKIVTGGPADRAGLGNIDVVVQVNGKDLPDMPTPQLVVASFSRMLNRMAVGDKVTFTLDSGKTVSLTLTARPEGPNEVPRYANVRVGLYARDKALIDPYISPGKAMETDGVIVLNVARDTPAIKGDLQRGDVITEIGDQPVRTVATLKTLLTTVIKDDKDTTLIIKVQRQDESKTLTIKVPPKKKPEKPEKSS